MTAEGLTVPVITTVDVLAVSSNVTILPSEYWVGLPLFSQLEVAVSHAVLAVPVHLRKLFTYKLPSSMQAATRVGSRVMVQLGAKPTVGYVVALLPKLRTGTSLVESELKEIQELLDVDPPLTPEVLEITRWVSDYYAAPWGEVMRAALPAGINASVERTISIVGG